MAKIRTASRADIDAVLAFWQHATTEPSMTDDATSVTNLIDHAPDALVLAVDGDEIVGALIVGWDGWRGTMYRLAVAPEQRVISAWHASRRTGSALASVCIAYVTFGGQERRNARLSASVPTTTGSGRRCSRCARSD